ncbi:MAG TPA: glycoside hydrolase family 9 protein, partial [Fibrobacteria bacterium]|nr:glycoside hydrolase family 9 protein [Fibrobacteria bacterium]
MAHPHSIRFLLAIGLAAELAGAAGKLTAPDYQKALWITTRFYGGQRAGVGPNWLLMDQPNKVSYIKDSADGRDLTGGWFDCGDFPL